VTTVRWAATALSFGAGGGSGGSAILIASSQSIVISSTGIITAQEGGRGSGCTGQVPGGSGGAIRLVAPSVLVQGPYPTLNAYHYGALSDYSRPNHRGVRSRAGTQSRKISLIIDTFGGH
jgi:hypothetical protein